MPTPWSISERCTNPAPGKKGEDNRAATAAWQLTRRTARERRDNNPHARVRRQIAAARKRHSCRRLSCPCPPTSASRLPGLPPSSSRDGPTRLPWIEGLFPVAAGQHLARPPPGGPERSP